MKRKIIAVTALLLLLCTLVSCGGQKEPKGKGKKEGLLVATVVKFVGDPWFDCMGWLGDQWAEEHNSTCRYIGDPEFDSAAQLQCLSDAIALNPDILTVVPIAADACDELLKQARDNGIVVVTHEGATLQNIDYNVDAFDNTAFGINFCQKIAELYGEDTKVALFVGQLTVPSHNAWAKAIYEYAKENYPNMQFVNETDAQGNIIPFEGMDDEDVSYSLTKELLQRYPDLEVIWTGSGSNSPGIARAITDLGKIGSCYSVPVDTPSWLEEYYESGVVQYSSFWYPGHAQYAAFEVGYRLLNGIEIKTGDDLGIDGYHNIIVDGKNIYGEAWYDVTPENVGELKDIL